MQTDHSLDHSTLVILSWGAPERLKMQLPHVRGVGQKVIWIDPLAGPRQLDSLIGADGIERIEAVLSRSAGEMELSRYSLPDLYSLRPAAAALTALMPGLKLAGTVPVQGIVAEVLGRTLAKVEGPIQVIIDTPGDEQAVLEFLDEAQVLKRVDTLVLRCGVEPFFEESAHIKTLLKTLNEKCFSVVEVDKIEDPDWPLYILKLDQRAQLIQSLENVVTQTQADLAMAQEEVTTLRANLDMRTKERDAAKASIAQRDAALSTLRLEQKKTAALSAEKMLRLEHDLDQMKIDLRRAANAQERAQAETDALELRHTTAQEERQNLVHLLQQLTPKLREAAKYVREIPLAEQSDVEALMKGATPDSTKNKKRT